MTKVLIVENNPRIFSDRIRARGLLPYGEVYRAALEACEGSVETEICAPYDGESLPDLTAFDGAVFTGSSVPWDTQSPEAAPLADALRACFAAGLPVFGSCNGMQLAASVLGGFSTASPHGREDGLARGIVLTDAGQNHPLLAERQQGFAAPCIHRDEVTELPVGAVLLAGNAHSPVQAFAYEDGPLRFWGTQYHPELSLEFISITMKALDLLPADQATALAISHQDEAAATLLGVRPEDVQSAHPHLEVRNWLRSL